MIGYFAFHYRKVLYPLAAMSTLNVLCVSNGHHLLVCLLLIFPTGVFMGKDCQDFFGHWRHFLTAKSAIICIVLREKKSSILEFRELTTMHLHNPFHTVTHGGLILQRHSSFHSLTHSMVYIIYTLQNMRSLYKLVLTIWCHLVTPW